MSLRTTLDVKTTTLLYQQDTYCSVGLKNRGTKPVEILVPPLDKTMPIVHVCNVQTGAEDIYQREPAARSVRHESGQLPPGESVESEFRLFDVVPVLDPGDYDIRIGWTYDEGAATSQSETVRIKVLPTTPKSLAMADAYGGNGGLKFGVWVNLAGVPDGPPTIVRNRLTLKKGGGVSQVLQVAECVPSCRPVVSSPAVGTVVGSQWVGWVDGTVLYFTHVDDELGVAALQSGALPEEGFDIVAPLYSEAVVDTTVRPAGGMLLCQGSGDGSQFGLQALQLKADQVSPLGAVTLAGPKPRWIMSHVRSSGQRLVSYVQSGGTEFVLNMAPWPGIKSNMPGSLRMASWPGEFIAAGASMDRDDGIRGGILFWKMTDEGPRQLVLATWSVSSSNEFAEGQELEVDWHPNEAVREARIGLSDDGAPAALIADEEGTWKILDGQGNLQPVPIQFEKTKQTLELAFMNGVGEPLLICGTVSAGLRILRLDGSPLPPRPTSK